jgi:hypothetical protein
MEEAGIRWTLWPAMAAFLLSGCAATIDLTNPPYAQQGQPLRLAADVKPWMTSIQGVNVTYAAPAPGGPLNPQSTGGTSMAVEVPGSAAWADGQEVRYTWTVRYTVPLGGTQTRTAQARLFMTHPRPVLTHPHDSATGVWTPTLFEWNAVPGASYYVLRVNKRASGAQVFDAWIPGTNNTIPLESQTEYEWQVFAVFAVDPAGTSLVWGPDTGSPRYRFTTQ